MKSDISVQTPARTYPVYVRSTFPGPELFQFLDTWSPDKLFLIIDENFENIHGESLKRTMGQTAEIAAYTVPSGEASKSYGHWKKVTDFLLSGGARRNSLVVAAGGGVTGDLAGFAASTAMRGLPLVHIPTTLLAMVDSSIGGKTGINHPMGKNLIGSFYQPEAIFINTGYLSSLPEKEWINGLSEILKYGSIEDPSIFNVCEDLFLNRGSKVDGSDPKLVELIRKCVRIKAGIVEADEKESGLRMNLNFGHTFGHALESLGGYNSISHGEAVFAGMLAACNLSSLMGASIKSETIEKFRTLYNINPDVFEYPADKLVKTMYHDKKRSSKSLKVVLLQDWGEPYVTELEDTAPVTEAWLYSFGLLRADK